MNILKEIKKQSQKKDFEITKLEIVSQAEKLLTYDKKKMIHEMARLGVLIMQMTYMLNADEEIEQATCDIVENGCV